MPQAKVKATNVRKQWGRNMVENGKKYKPLKIQFACNLA